MTRKELLVEAELGFAPAQYQVGVECYAERDVANAIAWYRKAAEGGFAPAQDALGDMYSEGLGVEKNDAIAAEWYCKAAEQGHPRALTVVLRKPPGETSPEILPRAIVACRKAAADGNAEALCWLADAHENGTGVEKDSALAARLYNTAVARGLHKQARSWVGGMAQRGATVEAAGRQGGRTEAIKREWLVLLGFVAFMAVLIGYGLYVQYRDRERYQRAFNAMTPAKHLIEAQSALRAGLYTEALAHARAITTGPEVSEARKIEQEVSNAREVGAQMLQGAREAEAQRLQAARSAEESRRVALNDLQRELKNLGYDLTVAQSDQLNEVLITSKDFGETDHRVRFLSFLRGRNSPTTGVCLSGFQNVRLKDSSSFFGFSEVYSLDCFSFR
jgi:TPR repeat protein